MSSRSHRYLIGLRSAEFGGQVRQAQTDCETQTILENLLTCGGSVRMRVSGVISFSFAAHCFSKRKGATLNNKMTFFGQEG